MYIYIYIIYIHIYITRLSSNEIFYPSNKTHREVGRAKDLSAPLYFVASDCLSIIQQLVLAPRKATAYTAHTLRPAGSGSLDWFKTARATKYMANAAVDRRLFIGAMKRA